ncbi:MAG: carbamoyltransferase family protein [Pyrinomonadaceae bacterium]
MYILGINAYHGDASAAIVRDGELIAAVEEERFNRIKHCAGFPTRSIEYCLRAAGISIEDVEHVGISRNPSAHLHKKIVAAAKKSVGAGQWATAGARIAGTPVTDSAPAVPSVEIQDAPGNGNGHFSNFARQLGSRIRNAGKVRDLKNELARALGVSAHSLRAQFHNIEHHRAHLASAFFVSPFERAAVLSIDGFGDFVSTMWGVGEGNSIRVLGQVEYPHSLGIVYTATTQFLGFRHYGDEGKVMGLAPYGEPRFIEQFREIVSTEPKGKFRLNLDYFRHATDGVEMTWDGGSPEIGQIFSSAYARAFGAAREAGSQLTDRESDIAASLQLRLEEVAFHVLNHLQEETGLTDLGLAGGVAYNSVLNGKILRATPFRRVFVQPAAGDSGTALGVCYQIWNDQRPGRAKGRALSARAASPIALGPLPFAPYTGPEFSNDEIKHELEASEIKCELLSDDELINCAARDIADGLIVGWFQGRMEFGPRALGNRSILADPRRADIKNTLNERIKKREAFRPFAPSVLAEHVGDYFEQTHPSPAMLMVYEIKPERRSQIPAVTHIDGSGRLQTVTRELNPTYYRLIEEFYQLTGVPIVLNTSFNENEPVVCTPRDAIDCFLKTRIDVLYLGNYAVRRREV